MVAVLIVVMKLSRQLGVKQLPAERQLLLLPWTRRRRQRPRPPRLVAAAAVSGSTRGWALECIQKTGSKIGASSRNIKKKK